MQQGVATFKQSNYAGQSGAVYPARIDGDIQVGSQINAAFAPHQVPASPATPVLSQSAGGSIGATTYYAKLTYVTPSGETIPSAEANLAVGANNLLNVAAPATLDAVPEATGYNVYVSTSAGTETRQNGSTPISLGTPWVEPTSGLVAGAALPAGLSQMSILVDQGALLVNQAVVLQNQQQTSVLTAPVSNPRIDRVVVNQATGVISVIAGTEAASPVAPALTSGVFPCAQILLSVGMTQIGNSLITDERIVAPPFLGKQTFFVPAGAMMPTITAGAIGPNQYETATNKVNYKSMDFAHGSKLNAQFAVNMPKQWDKGTITVRFHYLPQTINNNVFWGAQAVALRGGVAIDTAFGTAQTIASAAGGTANNEVITVDSPAITIAGIPQARDDILIQIYRDGASGSDTNLGSARLLGVDIIYTTLAANDS